MLRRSFALFVATDGVDVNKAAAQLKHKLLSRDITLNVPSADGRFRISFASTTHALRDTVRRHELVPVLLAAPRTIGLMGEHLCLTNMLASQFDGEERVESSFTFDAFSVRSQALALGECVCFPVTQSNDDLRENGAQPFPLVVNQIRYGKHEPFRSTTVVSAQELFDDTPPTPAGTLAGAAEAEEDVPFAWSEVAQRCSAAQWRELFRHNLTPHAYGYFRRSEGASVAVWLHADIATTGFYTEGLVAPDGSLLPDRTATGKAEENDPEGDQPPQRSYSERLASALGSDVRSSFGVSLMPLAAGAAVDRRVWRAQNALGAAAAELLSTTTTTETQVLAPIIERAHRQHTVCRDVLSLISGDFDGAHAAAKAARQYHEDPAAVAAVIEPIRAKLNLSDFVIPLAPQSAQRTGLDFFCRCTKRAFLDALLTVPDDTIEAAKASPTVSCKTCNKTYTLTPEDIADLIARRSQSK